MILAGLWLVLDQGRINTTPLAMASEAPDRHYPNHETFTKKEVFDFSFALAGDIRRENPNILPPAVLLLLGSWMFHRGRASRAH